MVGSGFTFLIENLGMGIAREFQANKGTVCHVNRCHCFHSKFRLLFLSFCYNIYQLTEQNKVKNWQVLRRVFRVFNYGNGIFADAILGKKHLLSSLFLLPTMVECLINEKYIFFTLQKHARA